MVSVQEWRGRGGTVLREGPVTRIIPLKGGDEWDAFTGWRRAIRWRRGALRAIKRRYGKRMRKAGKVRRDTAEG